MHFYKNISSFKNKSPKRKTKRKTKNRVINLTKYIVTQQNITKHYHIISQNIITPLKLKVNKPFLEKGKKCSERNVLILYTEFEARVRMGSFFMDDWFFFYGCLHELWILFRIFIQCVVWKIMENNLLKFPIWTICWGWVSFYSWVIINGVK